VIKRLNQFVWGVDSRRPKDHVFGGARIPPVEGVISAYSVLYCQLLIVISDLWDSAEIRLAPQN